MFLVSLKAGCIHLVYCVFFDWHKDGSVDKARWTSRTSAASEYSNYDYVAKSECMKIKEVTVNTLVMGKYPLEIFCGQGGSYSLAS